MLDEVVCNRPILSHQITKVASQVWPDAGVGFAAAWSPTFSSTRKFKCTMRCHVVPNRLHHKLPGANDSAGQTHQKLSRLDIPANKLIASKQFALEITTCRTEAPAAAHETDALDILHNTIVSTLFSSYGSPATLFITQYSFANPVYPYLAQLLLVLLRRSRHRVLLAGAGQPVVAQLTGHIRVAQRLVNGVRDVSVCAARPPIGGARHKHAAEALHVQQPGVGRNV